MASTDLNNPPQARLWRRLVRWTIYGLIALISLLALNTWYVVTSFDTETLPDRYGQVDAQLYLEPSTTGHAKPLLVLLGGAEGGNAWTRSRWKAQRDRFLAQGYAVLAIGYFGLPNTPEKLDRIGIEGIHAAIVRAAQNPEINRDCVAVLGGSRGAELALLLGSRYPDIRTVVALSPSSAVFVSHTDAMVTSAFAFEGQPLPFVPMLWSATPELILGDIGGVMRKLVGNQPAMDAAAIPVEQINGPLLLVSAAQDEMWPSREMSDAMMARLNRSGFEPAHEHWALPGGHSSPTEEFLKIEAFLNAHFAPNRGTGGCAE